jgi:hypothetical protein
LISPVSSISRARLVELHCLCCTHPSTHTTHTHTHTHTHKLPFRYAPDHAACGKWLKLIRALERGKTEGNDAFRTGRHAEAVKLYTAALERLAGASSLGELGLPAFAAMLHANRAAALGKLKRYEGACGLKTEHSLFRQTAHSKPTHSHIYIYFPYFLFLFSSLTFPQSRGDFGLRPGRVAGPVVPQGAAAARGAAAERWRIRRRRAGLPGAQGRRERGRLGPRRPAPRQGRTEKIQAEELLCNIGDLGDGHGGPDQKGLPDGGAQGTSIFVAILV